MSTKDLFPEAVEVISSEAVECKIAKGEKLRVKFGADPSRPDLHLGHFTVFRRLKKLQDLGHKVVFIIGDFTGMIGDPTGKNKARVAMTREDVADNAKTYFEQVGRVLDISKTEIVYNSEWFSKFTLEDVLDVCGKTTVAQIIERDDFSKRIKGGTDIGLNELLYPVMQGYDSVMVKSDVEIGGTDQKFNMLMGRGLQRKYGQASQAVVTMPLLVGLDGVKKMSKSEDNFIAIGDTPENKYGKIMSIPDSTVVAYLESITDFSVEEIKKLKEEFKLDPRAVKAKLAYEIVRIYDGSGSADVALDYFHRTVVKREAPTEIEEYKAEAGEELPEILQKAGLVGSNSELNRLIAQGGVSINGEKLDDPKVNLENGMLVKVGKRKFLKIIK